MNLFSHIGRYCLLVADAFSKPEKLPVYWKRLLYEMDVLGINSLGLITLMSLFMGAVITLQTASNIDSPLIPLYTVGFATRESIILEFSPTMLSLILAGKVGSNIGSEIGSMRVTEQIDALEIMGVNSPAYLILPKIIAAVLIFPFLVILSMVLGILGGWIVAVASGLLSAYEYQYGILYEFDDFHVTYALIKTVVFAFLITSISAYHGFYTKGSALEVGKSSTRGVVHSSVAILIMNYVITQLLLI